MLALAATLPGCAATRAIPPPLRTTATATPEAPGLPGQARSLVGDTPAEITATLGTPALRRNEGEAEIWLYATPGGCRVHLVLYRKGGRETVAHASTNTPAHQTEAACLREIAGARADPPVI